MKRSLTEIILFKLYEISRKQFLHYLDMHSIHRDGKFADIVLGLI